MHTHAQRERQRKRDKVAAAPSSWIKSLFVQVFRALAFWFYSLLDFRLDFVVAFNMQLSILHFVWSVQHFIVIECIWAFVRVHQRHFSFLCGSWKKWIRQFLFHLFFVCFNVFFHSKRVFFSTHLFFNFSNVKCRRRRMHWISVRMTSSGLKSIAKISLVKIEADQTDRISIFHFTLVSISSIILAISLSIWFALLHSLSFRFRLLLFDFWSRAISNS